MAESKGEQPVGAAYQTAGVFCCVCNYTWQAVFPVEAWPKLGCPNCGHRGTVFEDRADG